MYYSKLDTLIQQYQVIALCTIVKAKGSTPLKEGHKLIVLPDGKILGTIGGGELERVVIEDALNCIQKREHQLFEHHLTKDHQMCCGGMVSIFIEVLMSPPVLLIAGAGHIGRCLSDIASNCGFQVMLIDNRKEILSQIKNDKDNIQLIYADDIANYIREYNHHVQNGYCVITTYNHQLDRKILLEAVGKPFKYIGMIGSKRKVLMTKKFLKENGINEYIIEKIDMPIGLNINAESPYEIAVSIMGKLIAVKNEKKKIKETDSENENIELCRQNVSL
ncbi:MAG: hypothetical protein Fur0023_09800 [Bacteroidia bacterium]